MKNEPTFDEVLRLVRQLSPADRRRLIERVAPEVESDQPSRESRRDRSLLGLAKDLGPAPSEEEIDATRKEAWAGFPREDI